MEEGRKEGRKEMNRLSDGSLGEKTKKEMEEGRKEGRR
jgi:hypothetical protein